MMDQKIEIKGVEEIKILVDAFYTKVKGDDLLGPVFASRIPNDSDWPKHLEKMYRFWTMVLFTEPVYRGNPFCRDKKLLFFSRGPDRSLLFRVDPITPGHFYAAGGVFNRPDVCVSGAFYHLFC